MTFSYSINTLFSRATGWLNISMEQMRQDNEKGIDYESKHYTMYEATQRQRQIERGIRKQKRRILVDEKAGDKENLQSDQIHYQMLEQEYRRFSKAAGLRLQHERMEMSGFGPKQARAAAEPQKLLENQGKMAYNNQEETLRLIRSNEISKVINKGSQNKHILGTSGYIQGKSYIYGDLETAQSLIDTYHGTGKLIFNRKGEWSNKEVAISDHVIGVNIDPQTGEETETNRFVIHYGKKGTHVVPTRELKE